MGPTIHASAVLVGETGVLIRGPSGSGKSTLVLQMLASKPETTFLIADDRVHLAAHHGRLVATVPQTIAGHLEIRGLGIVRQHHVSPAVIRWAVDLLPSEQCPRFPDDDRTSVVVETIPLRRIAIPIAACGGVERVRAALAGVGDLNRA
ncbi:MAG: serine/threonine protein kinase [Hyphomicrobiales bacterium]|nr:serine/threonine protein kinase [Hyphomicrobiales bacterium]